MTGERRRSLAQQTAVAMLLGCLASPVYAQSDGAAALFDVGTRAFEAGDYAAAAQAFEQARGTGLDRPALYYNLGSTYFRLGRYGQAAAAFERLVGDPEFTALAHYNLGLVAQRTGEWESAERHFRLALASSRDERLRYLARRQLRAERLAEPERGWDGRAFAVLGVGYDDNVNLIPTDVATSKGDHFVEAFASASAVVLGTRTDGLSLHGDAYLQRYDEITENDYARLRLLGRANRQLGGWRTFVGGFASRDTLAGDDFQRGFGVEAGAERPVSDNALVAVSVLHEDLRSLDNEFEYLEGQRRELRAEYFRYWDDNDMGLYYELEWNDREDTAIESYSPTRHTLRLHLGRRFEAGWRLRADASYRLSDYPAAPLVDREDDRWRTRLSATRELGRHWSLRGGWESQKPSKRRSTY